MAKNRTLRLPGNLDEMLRVEAAYTGMSVHALILAVLETRAEAWARERAADRSPILQREQLPEGTGTEMHIPKIPRLTTTPPDTHQADTTPDQRTATADGPGAPDFLDVQNPPDRGTASLRAARQVPVSEGGDERARQGFQRKPLCTCGPGERAKGKHNKKCPARGEA